ncbi:hypothetical protein [Salarchaeum sp. JOR-1]|uniref:hypothetical protein n=1 Tax=Salarchaeum sp. JOR-1 TaxID=2599399 RepID=UPI001198B758|nr:hypothetical protein [Salarchaeum sp. JOR-1]QDX40275.1 hypothetical protein FQU85_04945 [Salarchaeum sp. JOR-1]
MSTEQFVTANDVAQTTNKTPAEIEAAVWRTMAQQALGEVEANQVYEDTLAGVLNTISANTDADSETDTDPSGVSTYEDYLEAENAEKIQADTGTPPTDYGEYLETNEGRQLKRINGELHLTGGDDA